MFQNGSGAWEMRLKNVRNIRLLGCVQVVSYFRQQGLNAFKLAPVSARQPPVQIPCGVGHVPELILQRHGGRPPGQGVKIRDSGVKNGCE